MSNRLDWRSYVNPDGDFELPTYLFRLISDLMKTSLDFGTMLSSDPAKTRAYKEQIKTAFKKRWLELAQALEEFEITEPCGCPPKEFCKLCGGARYRLHSALTADRMREIALVTTPGDPTLAAKLEAGLHKALEETEGLF